MHRQSEKLFLENAKVFFNRLRVTAIARELSDPAVSISKTTERFGFINTFYFLLQAPLRRGASSIQEKDSLTAS